jgi:CRP-like cAMP-binding protein
MSSEMMTILANPMDFPDSFSQDEIMTLGIGRASQYTEKNL